MSVNGPLFPMACFPCAFAAAGALGLSLSASCTPRGPPLAACSPFSAWSDFSQRMLPNLTPVCSPSTKLNITGNEASRPCAALPLANYLRRPKYIVKESPIKTRMEHTPKRWPIVQSNFEQLSDFESLLHSKLYSGYYYEEDVVDLP